MVVELEHLKTKTRLIDEKFASVRGLLLIDKANRSLIVSFFDKSYESCPAVLGKDQRTNF